MSDWLEPVEMVSRLQLDSKLLPLVTAPPALTRMEPVSVSGDPAPRATAEVADPLWFLGRQWQLGELVGEDVGSPVSVLVESRSLPVTAWLPEGDGSQDAGRAPWPRGVDLDELVEHAPRAAADRGLRRRAETGAQLHADLIAAGCADSAELLLAAHPHGPPDGDVGPDPVADRLFAVLQGTVPDGAAALDALADGTPWWIGGAAHAADAGARLPMTGRRG